MNYTPVSLIGDPFAKRFATASQIPGLPMNNGSQPGDALDFFPAPDTTDAACGLAVVVLNSLPHAIKVADTLFPSFPAGFGTQVQNSLYSGPAMLQGASAIQVNEIPGARPYPRQQAHLRPQGGPAMLGGLGLFRIAPFDPGGAPCIYAGMSFSTGANGKGSQFALAVRGQWDSVNHVPAVPYLVAVTTDLVTNFVDLPTFSNKKLALGPNGYSDGPHPATVYEVGTNGVTIWATLSAVAKQEEMMTLTVWVRDLGSTLGY